MTSILPMARFAEQCRATLARLAPTAPQQPPRPFGPSHDAVVAALVEAARPLTVVEIGRQVSPCRSRTARVCRDLRDTGRIRSNRETAHKTSALRYFVCSSE